MGEKLEDYLNVRQFASEAGASVQAIHKAIKDGRIKKVRRIGAFYLVSKEEIGGYKETKR